MALSKKQQAFVEHYLREWNATRAAVLAGYAERSARQQGSRLLSNDDIAAAIQARLDELKMSADEVLVRLGQQARAEYAQYITMQEMITDTETGTKQIVPIFDLDRCAEDGNLHLIKGWKYDAQGRLVIEFYDAQAALVQIGRHHKLFTDRTEIPGLDELKAYVGISPDEWDEVEDGEGGAGAPGAG